MMIEPERLRSWLERSHRIRIHALAPVSGGEDANAMGFRADTDDGRSLFVKIRRGRSKTNADLLLALFERLGSIVVAPVADGRGRLTARFAGASVTVFPYVEGIDGFQSDPSLAQMHSLGQAIRRLHDVEPRSLRQTLPAFRIGIRFLDRLTKQLDALDQSPANDVLSTHFRTLLEPHRTSLSHLLGETRDLYERRCDDVFRPVVCHGDLHAGNLLLGKDGEIRIVDWDGLCRGPAELDLMMIGAGIGGKLSSSVAVAAFYDGYGAVTVDRERIRLLRSLRIVEDLSLFTTRILDPSTSEADRRRDIGFVLSNFAPGETIDRARNN